MRDQTTVTALLDEDITVDNENTDLADIDGVALFNKYLVSVMALFVRQSNVTDKK